MLIGGIRLPCVKFSEDIVFYPVNIFQQGAGRQLWSGVSISRSKPSLELSPDEHAVLNGLAAPFVVAVVSDCHTRTLPTVCSRAVVKSITPI